MIRLLICLLIFGFSFNSFAAPAALQVESSISGYLDNAGKILANGKIEFFTSDAYSTYKPVYSDAAKTTVLAQPISLNSSGIPVNGAGTPVAIFADGVYWMRLKSSAGLVIRSYRSVTYQGAIDFGGLYIDVASSYGRTDTALTNALADYGGSSSQVTFLFNSGEFINSSARTLPSNVKFLFVNGAYLTTSGAIIAPNVWDFQGNSYITNTSTVTFSGASIVAPSGAYIFKGSGTITGNITNKEVYPEWFGLKRDGTDETNIINKTIDFSSTYGKKVLILPGTICAVNIIPKNNTYIYGTGENSEIKLHNSALISDFGVFYIYDKSNIKISNIKINGDKENTVGTASTGPALVRILKSNNIEISDCKLVSNNFQAIRLENGNSSTSFTHHIFVRQNKFLDVDCGISSAVTAFYKNTEDVFIENNYFDGGISEAVSCGSGIRWNVIGNIIKNKVSGIEVRFQTKDSNFSNNIIYGCLNGILVNYFTSTVFTKTEISNCLFSNNVISSCNEGINSYGAAKTYVYNSQFTNNTLKNITNNGLFLYGLHSSIVNFNSVSNTNYNNNSSDQLRLQFCTGNQVVGNVFDDNRVSKLNYTGLRLLNDCHNNILSYNTIKKSNYGFQIQNNCTGNIVNNNLFHEISTGVRLTGTAFRNVISDNSFYNTTVTYLNSSTQYNIYKDNLLNENTKSSYQVGNLNPDVYLSLSSTANLNLTSGSWKVITWNTEISDINGMHAINLPTVNIVEDGKYHIQCVAVVGTRNSNITYGIRVYLGSDILFEKKMEASQDNLSISISEIAGLKYNDTLYIAMYANGGTDPVLCPGSVYTRFRVTKLD